LEFQIKNPGLTSWDINYCLVRIENRPKLVIAFGIFHKINIICFSVKNGQDPEVFKFLGQTKRRSDKIRI